MRHAVVSPYDRKVQQACGRATEAVTGTQRSFAGHSVSGVSSPLDPDDYLKPAT